MSTHVDTVLFKKCGRAAPMPILSVAANDPALTEKIAAVKQQHIAAAVSGGAEIPEFFVETGHVEKGAK